MTLNQSGTALTVQKIQNNEQKTFNKISTYVSALPFPLILTINDKHTSEIMLYVVMWRFWFFHVDSSSIRFFAENSMSILIQFFCQEIPQEGLQNASG